MATVSQDAHPLNTMILSLDCVLTAHLSVILAQDHYLPIAYLVNHLFNSIKAVVSTNVLLVSTPPQLITANLAASTVQPVLIIQPTALPAFKVPFCKILLLAIILAVLAV